MGAMTDKIRFCFDSLHCKMLRASCTLSLFSLRQHFVRVVRIVGCVSGGCLAKGPHCKVFVLRASHRLLNGDAADLIKKSNSDLTAVSENHLADAAQRLAQMPTFELEAMGNLARQYYQDHLVGGRRKQILRYI